MRAFIAVLALVSVAAAAVDNHNKPLAQHVHDKPVDMRVVPVYGASDVNFQLSQEKYGVKALTNLPFVFAFKLPGNDKETFAYRLGHGVQTLYEEPELSFIVDDALLGPGSVILYQSAARALGIPEVKLPVVKKSFYKPSVVVVADDFDTLPWVYGVYKKDLPVGALDKLVELGQFAVHHDKFELVHDILAEQASGLKQEVHPSLLPIKEIIPGRVQDRITL